MPGVICNKVSEYCPVEATIYGYRPSLGWNVWFAIFFGVASLLHLGLGLRYKTWTYMIGVGLGCLAECGGYYGRLMMNNNPFDDIGFQIQVVLLIFAPSFLAAGIYLTLKHIVIHVGEPWSRLRPNFYTYIFIGCDVTSLVLQSLGGAMAAMGGTNKSQIDLGTNIMLAGIVWQVIVLIIFGYLVAEYAFRTYRRKVTLSEEASTLIYDRKFHLFALGVFIAYLTIFVRCVYRIPELQDGWGGKLMRKEPDFIGFEGIMIMFAVLAQTIFHPGHYFPAMTSGKAPAKKRHGKGVGSRDSRIEMVNRV
ncbi:sphingoid long-chain base transporter RSB1 [Byssothecium circinans]|uniref:Sphingoid long-chain base transporter RSB1 n=1 Tax=Byssothecium circinans TaxID=147558 RepID=A0A6A5UCK0_9PLEO|nr:sphingoid long-chain base transporter RSB1 [Byssothecium circinans]